MVEKVQMEIRAETVGMVEVGITAEMAGMAVAPVEKVVQVARVTVDQTENQEKTGKM